ncbi:MAG: bifunctional DNA primase/polymerase [Planctomycetes bacterium]|nr:bifunctional DNA primase/polymerase [Planctomycetota bacterium]
MKPAGADPTTSGPAPQVYYDAGLHPHPLYVPGEKHRTPRGVEVSQGKEPRESGWQTRSRVDALALFERYPNSNVGLRLDGLADCDFDWPETIGFGGLLLPDLPSFGGGSHRLATCRRAKYEHFTLPVGPLRLPFDLPEEHERKVVELLTGTGKQVRVPPSLHQKGHRIEWDAGTVCFPLPPVDADFLRRRLGICAFLGVVQRAWPTSHGNHRTATLALARVLLEALPGERELVTALLKDVKRVCPEDTDPGHAVESTARKAAEGEERLVGLPSLCVATGLQELQVRFEQWLGVGRTSATRPPRAGAICLDPGRYVLDELARGLREKGEPLYRRSGRLVRPVVVDESGPDEVGVRREAGSLVIREVTPTWLAAEARRVLLFWATRGRGPAPANLTRGTAAELLETESAWPWPVLRGVTAVPVLLPDGRVLSEPGFDRGSRLLYRPPAGLELTPVGETREEAEAAMARIARLFSEFPWCPRGGTSLRESPSHSVALSAVLSGFVARSIPAVPLHAFDAPDSRVGKSLAATVVGLILTGLRLPATDYDGEGEEGWKRLASVLLTGDPAVLLDNVEKPLTGPTLCSMISESATRIRTFGKLEDVVVPSNVLVLATGINLRARNDMVKRVVKGRMDAEREDPEAREFEADPCKEVLARRGEYVRDALTVLRAHALAGFPGDPKASDFTDWGRLVRGTILWLGYADPVETQRDLAAGDPDREAMVEVFLAWDGLFGRENEALAGGPVHRTLARVFRELAPSPSTEDGERPRRTPEQDRLYRALVALEGGKENSRAIGRRFAEWEDRRAEGFVLERGRESRDGVRWRIRRT